MLALEPGAGEAHKRFCIDHGQRENQFKTLALQYQDDFSFPYARHLLEFKAKGAVDVD